VPALEKHIKPLAQSVNAAFTTLCNVSKGQELDQLFSQVEKEWGSFDILIHSIAFANKEDLDSRFVETSRKAFALALDISANCLCKTSSKANASRLKNLLLLPNRMDSLNYPTTHCIEHIAGAFSGL
jgi:enoyl-[acyl-carrier-protein] reductase (NADH)